MSLSSHFKLKCEQENEERGLFTFSYDLFLQFKLSQAMNNLRKLHDKEFVKIL